MCLGVDEDILLSHIAAQLLVCSLERAAEIGWQARVEALLRCARSAVVGHLSPRGNQEDDRNQVGVSRARDLLPTARLRRSWLLGSGLGVVSPGTESPVDW